MLKEYRYRGHISRQCERVKGEHNGKWIILSYAHGLLLDDTICAHYPTIQAAKDAVADEANLYIGGNYHDETRYH